MLISILILKANDATQKSKKFSSQSSLQAFKEYICMEGIEENKPGIHRFLFKKNLYKE